MSQALHALHALTELALWPFDRLPPWLALTAISVLSGVVMLWVLGKTSHQRGMERARDQMAAAIYEIRLFLDSPRRVLKAQARLAWWNLRYVLYMMPAVLVLMLPLGLLGIHLECRYGRAALPVGAPVVVTADLAPGADGRALTAEASGDLAVTAPVLFDAAERRAYVRVEARAPGAHTLRLALPGRPAVEKQVTAGLDGSVSPQRAAGLAHLWALGLEDPIPTESGIEAVDLPHPARDLTLAGLPMPWWLYWLVLSMTAAFALRRRLGVVL